MNIPNTPLKTMLTALLLFLVGGGTYYIIEILYRGYSHWSMAILGGVCFISICLINHRFSARNLLLRAILCALAITVWEFAAGCILNLWLGWRIWDYRTLPFNLMGQIAPLYTLFWFLLSLPICLISSVFERRKKRD